MAELVVDFELFSGLVVKLPQRPAPRLRDRANAMRRMVSVVGDLAVQQGLSGNHLPGKIEVRTCPLSFIGIANVSGVTPRPRFRDPETGRILLEQVKAAGLEHRPDHPAYVALRAGRWTPLSAPAPRPDPYHLLDGPADPGAGLKCVAHRKGRCAVCRRLSHRDAPTVEACCQHHHRGDDGLAVGVCEEHRLTKCSECAGPSLCCAAGHHACRRHNLGPCAGCQRLPSLAERRPAACCRRGHHDRPVEPTPPPRGHRFPLSRDPHASPPRTPSVRRKRVRPDATPASDEGPQVARVLKPPPRGGAPKTPKTPKANSPSSSTGTPVRAASSKARETRQCGPLKAPEPQSKGGKQPSKKRKNGEGPGEPVPAGKTKRPPPARGRKRAQPATPGPTASMGKTRQGRDPKRAKGPTTPVRELELSSSLTSGSSTGSASDEGEEPGELTLDKDKNIAGKKTEQPAVPGDATSSLHLKAEGSISSPPLQPTGRERGTRPPDPTPAGRTKKAPPKKGRKRAQPATPEPTASAVEQKRKRNPKRAKGPMTPIRKMNLDSSLTSGSPTRQSSDEVIT